MGLFVPAQKTLLELLQEAVPVGYVLILQIFELRQECSRLKGVVTVSFQFRKPFALLPHVFCTHRNMRFCLLQMPLQHLSANRVTRASNCIFLLFLEPMASIGDNLTRARKAAPCQCSRVHQIELKPFSRNCEPAPALGC